MSNTTHNAMMAEIQLSPEEVRRRDLDSEGAGSSATVPAEEDSPKIDMMRCEEEEEEEDDDDDVPPLTSPTTLSYDAPAFVPRAKPHVVNVFSQLLQMADSFPCDLATVTVQEIAEFACQRLGMPEGCELSTPQGVSIPSEGHLKAIDVGIANNSVVIAGPRPVPVAAPLDGVQQAAVFPPTLDAVGVDGQQALLVRAPEPEMHFGAAALPLAQPMVQPAPPVRTVTRVIKVITTQPRGGAAPVVAPPPVQLTPAPPQPSPPCTPPSPPGLSPIANEMWSYAVTNDGARALVQRIDGLTDPAPAVDRLVAELASELPALCTHQHGSKVVRALARRASPLQASRIAKLLMPAVPHAASSTAGSDVLTELLSVGVDADVQREVVAAITGPALGGVCCTVQGRKVIVTLLSKFSASAVAPLFEAIADNLFSLATDQGGCITVQRCLDCAVAGRNVHAHAALQQCVLGGLEHLLTDPYGNYVVQHAVKVDGAAAGPVSDHVAGRLLEFATNKFASNVVERCLENGTHQVKERIVAEVMLPHVVSVLINDAFGNFVVQSCVDHAPPAMMDTLRHAISPLLASSPYGYRIESKVQRRARRSGGRRGGGSGGGGRRSPPAYHTPPPAPQSPKPRFVYVSPPPQGMSPTAVRRVYAVAPPHMVVAAP